MEAIRSSEMSGTTLRTTERHIPEDDTLQNHRFENLKSKKNVDFFVVNPKINTKIPAIENCERIQKYRSDLRVFGKT
jgi:hypothetical protein